MSPYISDADLASTDLGQHVRSTTTVGDAMADTAAALLVDFARARATGRNDLMGLILDHAQAVDPDLLAELAGFDYPAAA